MPRSHAQTHANEVLYQQCDRRDPQEEDERPPSGNEVADAGVQPYRGEEGEQGELTCGEFELDPADSANERHGQRHEQPASHCLGDAVGLQQRDPCGEEPAKEVGEDRDDDRVSAVKGDHAHCRLPAARASIELCLDWTARVWGVAVPRGSAQPTAAHAVGCAARRWTLDNLPLRRHGRLAAVLILRLQS